MEEEFGEELDASQSRLLVVEMGRNKARYHRQFIWSPTIVAKHVKGHNRFAGRCFYKRTPAGL